MLQIAAHVQALNDLLTFIAVLAKEGDQLYFLLNSTTELRGYKMRIHFDWLRNRQLFDKVLSQWI